MSAEGMVMGLDYGEKRVGVALAHSVARIGQPHRTLPNDDDLLGRLLDVIKHEKIVQIVVGLPLNMDGSAGFQAESCRGFAGKLAQATSVPIVLQEETLSSVDAETQFSSKIIDEFGLDAAAAAVILDRYFAEKV